MGFHVDTTGNVWLGSGTTGTTLANAIAAGPPNFYVTTTGSVVATAGTIGGINLASTHIQSSNYSSTSGSEAGFKINSNGNAEFNDVTIRGILDGPTLTGNMSGGTSGTISVGASGDEVKIVEDSVAGGFITFNAGNATKATLSFDGSSLFEISSGLSTDISINSQGADLFLLSDKIYFKDYPSGSNTPRIFLWDGSQYNNQTNKVLGTDSSGNLTFATQSTSTVQDISGSGDISVSESSGVYTISHDDNDHSFASQSSVTALTNSLTNHVGHASSFVESLVATNSSTSSSTTSLTGDVTITSNAGGGGFIRGTPFVSGNNITINASVNGFIGQATPTGSTRKIGVSSSNRFNNIYSQNFFGTFYGLNVNASSKNIKENIEDTALGLDFINDLEVKDFTMIDTDTFGTQKFIGFIAEDVQKYLDDNDLDYKLTEDYRDKYEYKDSCSHPIVPDPQDEDQTITYMHDTVEECEAYMPDENRHPHLYFNNFVGPLVKAVQELSTQILDLTARVEALEG